jgi:hypothetical protein
MAEVVTALQHRERIVPCERLSITLTPILPALTPMRFTSLKGASSASLRGISISLEMGLLSTVTAMVMAIQI